jgi:hypothetical protein
MQDGSGSSLNSLAKLVGLEWYRTYDRGEPALIEWHATAIECKNLQTDATAFKAFATIPPPDLPHYYTRWPQQRISTLQLHGCAPMTAVANDETPTLPFNN